jgi:DNA-binding transcriptional LysR family regulator
MIASLGTIRASFKGALPKALAILRHRYPRLRIHVHSRINIDALEPIIRMVQHGLGVSVLPEPVGGEPLPPNIRKIPFGDPPLKRQLGIIYQKYL